MENETPVITPLLEPVGGTPAIIDTAPAFADALAQLERGVGPFAVDAERASGYRFSARAYLIQIKRSGGGLHLIDPLTLSLDECTKLNNLFNTDEVILHASTQDLPCLRELGINPQRLFDTELGARIAGFERVGLAPLLETLMGVSLAKEHSAVDWSTRPLPQEWLTYAALDVELLIELRAVIAASLSSQGKLEWALQDFQSILDAPAPPPRVDPWRRTSGMHKVKKREQLAIVRELWNARAEIAQREDIAQGRLITDAAIVELALAAPITKKGFEKALRPIGLRPRWSERVADWLAAIERALALSPAQLPELRSKGDGMPPTKMWREKFPERYAPYTHARHFLSELSGELSIPIENIISPELVRRLCWRGATEGEVDALLHEWGARPWQIALTGQGLKRALQERQPLVLENTSEGDELRNS